MVFAHRQSDGLHGGRRSRESTKTARNYRLGRTLYASRDPAPDRGAVPGNYRTAKVGGGEAEEIREFNSRAYTLSGGGGGGGTVTPKSYPYYTIMELRTARARARVRRSGFKLDKRLNFKRLAGGRANQPFHLYIGAGIRGFFLSPFFFVFFLSQSVPLHPVLDRTPRCNSTVVVVAQR